MADRTISVDLVGRDRSAGKALNDAGDSAERAGGKFGKLKAMGPALAAGMAGVGVAALGAGKMLYDTALSTELMGNKAKTVFGKDFPRAEKTAAKLATRLGMTTTETQGLLAGFGDLLTPMGFTTDKAVTLSGDMGTLTAALSQWSGGTRSAADVSDMLADALTGEYDSLKALGIQLDQDKVKGLLAAQGKDKLTGAALGQATAEVALKEIMKQSSNAMTAYDKGTNKAATAQLKLSSRMKQLKENAAKGLLPAFTWVLEKTNGLFDAFGKLKGGGDGLSGGLDKLKRAGSAVSTWWTTYLAPPLRKAADELFPKLKDTFRQVSSQFDSGGKTMGNLRLVANALGTVLGSVVIPIVTFLYKTHLRNFVTSIKAVATAFNGLMGVAKVVVRSILGLLGGIVNGAARAFGWVPGLGPKLKAAAAKFNEFRNSVNRSLSGIRDGKTVRINTRLSVSYESPDAVRFYRNNGTTIGLKARAVGGPVRKRQPYLVGEHGPELMVPDGSGTIVPAGRTRSLMAAASTSAPTSTPSRRAPSAPVAAAAPAPVVVQISTTGPVIGTSREFRDMVVTALTEAGRRGVVLPGSVLSTTRG